MLYFGYIFWLIPAIIILILVCIFDKKRSAYLDSIFTIHLGFTLALSGLISYRLDINQTLIISIVVLTVIFKIYALWFRKINLIKHSSYLGALTVVPWIYILFDTSFGDTYFEESALTSPGLEIFPNNIFSVLIIFIIFLSLIILKIQEIYIKILLVIVVFITSATLLGLYFASRMQVTNLVELWPRYKSTALTFVTLLTFLAILLIVDKALEDQANLLSPKHFITVLIFTVFLLLIYVIGHSSKTYTSYLPAGENSSAVSYKSCDNLVENKKLSGFLIERPEWGRQIIEACKGLLKESYVIAPSYQWGFHPIEIEDANKFWSWSYLEIATIFAVRQSSKEEQLQISFQLAKAACLDQVTVKIKNKGKTVKTVNLNTNDPVDVLIAVKADLYSPETIELWTDKQPCKIVGDERDLLIQVIDLQDISNPISRYKYFS